MSRRTWSLGPLLVGVALLASGRAEAQRSWNYLTTGNGHGFQIYDTNAKKIVSFLEHPYRFLRGDPANPRGDGIGRRNLAFDFYFGARGSGGSAWANQGNASDPGYVDESNIIRAPITAAGIATETYVFSPFGYEGNAMVALFKAPGATSTFALFNFHMGTGSNRTDPGANGESVRFNSAEKAMIETGPGGGALVYVALSGLDLTDCQNGYGRVTGGQDLSGGTSCGGDDLVPIFQQKNPADGWMAVAVQFVENAGDADNAVKSLRNWAAGRAPSKILSDALAEWEAWRKPIPADVNLSPAERAIWRQGEATLRMGQVREAFTPQRRNNGMVLASLPPGEWHTGWTRDAQYGIVALARSGHLDETRKALDFFLNAGPVGKYKSYVNNVDYHISVVRYFGNGEEEADYSGQPSPNIETDGWGLYLWAVRQYLDASNDRTWLTLPTAYGTPVYDLIEQKVARPIEQNMQPNGIMRADSSIWEVHDDNKRTFAYTTLSAARGLCDMATIAKYAGRDADVTKYQNLAAKIRTGFFASFLDRQGAIGGSVEELSQGNYIDAAVVEAITWNIADPKTRAREVNATLDLLGRLRVASGGFKRNDDGLSSYDNNEWILIDLRMANALRRAGRTAEADGVIQLVTNKVKDNFNLLPELFNATPGEGAIGKYAGSIPMVGYGGGAFILTMLDRAGRIERFDCGESLGPPPDGPPPVYDLLVPEGSDLTVIGGGNADLGIGPAVPYVPACLCRMGARGDLGGAALPLGSVWLLVGAGLVRRHLRRRSSR